MIGQLFAGSFNPALANPYKEIDTAPAPLTERESARGWALLERGLSMMVRSKPRKL